MKRKEQTLVGLSIALFLASCILFFPVAKTVLFAATLSVILVPFMTVVEERLWPEEDATRRRTLLALAVTAVTLAALLLAVALVVFIFVRNFQVLEDFGLQVAGRLEETAQDLFGSGVDLRAQAGESLQQLLGYVQGTFVAAAGVLVQLVIFSSALFLFLRHGRRMLRAFRQVLPSSHEQLFSRFADVTHSSLYAIYVVHVATAILTVILALPFFQIIGYGQHLLFWSLLCGSFQLIPVLGPSLIMVAIAIYAFAQGETTTGILILSVGYPVVAAVPDLVFRPLLLRSGMKMDAGILILGFFAGIVSMGMIGFVLGPLLLKLLVEALKLTREALSEGGA
jgi:predicted PurR-regulated permease PerM